MSLTSYVDRDTHSFFLAPASSNERKLNIPPLKYTSYGINGNPTRIFKHSSVLICVSLSNLIKESSTRGVFPNSMKIASVLPIYKTGDTKLVRNYRPISILPLNVLTHQQFGSQRDKSCADAVDQLFDVV